MEKFLHMTIPQKYTSHYFILFCDLIREGFKNPRHGNFPLRGVGVPHLSINFFPLRKRGPGGGGTPLTESFCASVFETFPRWALFALIAPEV